MGTLIAGIFIGIFITIGGAALYVFVISRDRPDALDKNSNISEWLCDGCGQPFPSHDFGCEGHHQKPKT